MFIYNNCVCVISSGYDLRDSAYKKLTDSRKPKYVPIPSLFTAFFFKIIFLMSFLKWATVISKMVEPCQF